MTKRELNAVYCEWEVRTAVLFQRIDDELGLNCTVGFYNGHYSKNGSGEYEREYYPIPVISVEGLCDVEIGLDGVSVSAKLRRDAALNFDYTALNGYKFEVYGVEDYLSDYYSDGDTLDDLVNNIRCSSETEIGFQFSFGKDVEPKRITDLIDLLRYNGFYY